MKLALGQINPTIGDFAGNQHKILSFVAKAMEMGAELVVFPEMCICGYPPMDLLDHDSFVEANLRALRRVQQSTPAGIGIVIGYVDKNRSSTGKSLVNTVSLIENGQTLLSQEKSLLPTYDVFDEARYFEASQDRRVIDYHGQRIGIAICEDIWWETDSESASRYPVDPVKDLLDRGATLILAPSASPYYRGKPQIRLSLLSRIGKSSGVPVVYVNMIGGNDSLIFDGQSMVTSKEGKLVFLGRAFAEELAVVDTAARHKEIALHTDNYGELEQALVLGTKDYLSKCGFDQAHVGLSGGIDSALVTALATEALGPERLRVLSMPSRYSSTGSLKDADQLAANLGLKLIRLPIEEPFKAYLASLDPVFRGLPADITEENLQARIRGTVLMAYSNKFSSFLLTTGNKSELATGYATLYGDMCGGLAVIGDLFKTEVYALARRINKDHQVFPDTILTKAPSAELKPDQADQDILPPYEILDQILDLYLIKNHRAEEIVQRGFEAALVHRVLSMVGKAEFKRRQAPPVLKVSRRAFGTGRRIPIARRLHEVQAENNGEFPLDS